MGAFVGHKVCRSENQRAADEMQFLLRLTCSNHGCPWRVRGAAESTKGSLYTITRLVDEHNHPLSPHPRREKLLRPA